MGRLISLCCEYIIISWIVFFELCYYVPVIVILADSVGAITECNYVWIHILTFTVLLALITFLYVVKYVKKCLDVHDITEISRSLLDTESKKNNKIMIENIIRLILLIGLIIWSIIILVFVNKDEECKNIYNDKYKSLYALFKTTIVLEIVIFCLMLCIYCCLKLKKY
jgi:hypothetical protein